jgi:hypothetical protein
MVGNAAAKERLALPAVANAKPTTRTEADFPFDSEHIKP